MTTTEYRTSRIVEASPEDVFAAWTDPDVLAPLVRPGVGWPRRTSSSTRARAAQVSDRDARRTTARGSR